MFTSPYSLSLSALLLASGISPVAAFWRLLCDNPITTGRYDPIVSPGAIAGHVHTIAGGSGFGMSTSYDQMRNASCTSCQIQQDLSNYWIPQLYYQNANNGSFESVDLIGGMTVYYLQRGDNVTAFPPGFRMLAGTPTLRASGSSLEQAAINYVCLDYTAGTTSSAGLPTKNCPQGLRAQIVFPSCWNGKDLDSTNHKSHMAYPDGISTGNCPAGFPIRLVTIFYEVTFIVDDFSGRWYSGRDQPFVFAMGDPTGYGLHGDFVNGWEQSFLQSAINTCTNLSGLEQDCPLFDLEYSQECHITPQVNEVVLGKLDTLPGCNPVQFGPASATTQTCVNMTTPTVWNTTVQYTGLTAPPTSHFLADQAQTVQNYSSWQYLGCYSDSSTRTLPYLVSVPGNLSIESCLDTCASNGHGFGAIEYGDQCWCGDVSPAAAGASLLTYASCGMSCTGNSLELCGGSWALSAYSNTAYVPPVIPLTSTDLSATYAGCYIDNANRIMPMLMGTTNGTVDGCVNACTNAQYPYSAVEYMGQCFCSSSMPSSSLLTSNSDCNMKCSGDNTKLCGAGYRLQMYNGTIKPYVPPAQIMPYAGCYTDTASSRTLKYSVSSNRTIEGCLASCTASGYKIAGLEYGGECWCDNVVSTSMTKAADSDCNMACSGNTKELCGAGNRLSIYNATALSPPSLQTSVAGLKYAGCYTDDGARVMTPATPKNQTIAGCISSCQALGYSQAGIEYGGECYCGALAARSVKAPDTDCSMVCNADQVHFCGAGYRLQVYNATSSSASSAAPSSAAPSSATPSSAAPSSAAPSSLTSSAVSTTASSSLATSSVATATAVAPMGFVVENARVQAASTTSVVSSAKTTGKSSSTLPSSSTKAIVSSTSKVTTTSVASSSSASTSSKPLTTSKPTTTSTAVTSSTTAKTSSISSTSSVKKSSSTVTSSTSTTSSSAKSSTISTSTKFTSSSAAKSSSTMKSSTTQKA